MTVSDELTSIYNYRYLKTRLEEEMNRANRYKFPLGLMMIDLDNFKEHNDTYGHLSGNKILKSIVGIINKNIRIIDVLCRYGGDEFAVILPNTGIEDTGISSAAERIRKKVEQSQFIFGKGKKKIKMSMSIGVAFYPQEAGSIKELISLADKAMYKAKKGGGNKSVIYQTKNNKRRKKI
jgi:diguanylate cyclase (GGDEF)-like protein